MSRLTPEILDAIERSVQGSCQSLENCVDQTLEFMGFDFGFYDLTSEEEMQLCDFIDNRHFLCAACGWWCEVGDYNMEACEASGENICSSCEW